MNKQTTEATKTEKSHEEKNAEGHAESILELYRAHKALEDGADMATVDGDEYTDADSVRERAQESALSVEVRGPWHVPGDEDGRKADEFKVLLTTGGPALQIIGDVGNYGEPDADSARMQVQDWGTPWTDYRPEAATADDWDDAFAWFIGCFYFGED
jgi:hypothetical protein